MTPTWRDAAMFMAGIGAGLLCLLFIEQDVWLDVVKNLGPLFYLAGLTVLVALRIRVH